MTTCTDGQCNTSFKRDIDNYLSMLRLFNESTEDFLYFWDLEDDRVYFARNLGEYSDILETSDNSYRRYDICKVIVDEYRERIFEAGCEYIRQSKDKMTQEYRIRLKNGKNVWVSNTVTTIYKDGKAIAASGCISLNSMSNKVDALTGLLNSIKFREDMDAYLETQKCGCLVVFGIDGLKDINAKYGRDFGDCIVKKVGAVLKDVVGAQARVYRMLGDEFAINLHHYDHDEVEVLFNNVQFLLKGSCTISAGVVYYNESQSSEISGAEIYQYAENALDGNETVGSINFFSTEQHEQYLARLDLLEELQGSMRNNYEGYFLVYQPIMDAVSHHPVGAEALLRYKSPTKGVVGPDRFIPILEETGLIEQVGNWVAKTAMEQCVEWRKKQPDFYISVNVSYIQLEKCGIAEDILTILQESGLPGRALTLEITESNRIERYSDFNEIFKKWKQAGIKIAIDDFGSGYANFSHLKNIAVDKIKIDRCFVSGINDNEYNLQILTNIFELAHNAQVLICCEGIEERDELNTLALMEPDEYQGYIFGRPFDRQFFTDTYIDSENSAYQERAQKHESLKASRKPANGYDLPSHKDGLQILKAKISKLPLDRMDLPLDMCPYILQMMDTGLWMMLFNEKAGEYLMYVSRTCARILGITEYMEPAEVFRHWYGRISEDHVYYVNRGVDKILNKGEMVQLEYTWNHPEIGEVTVRCVGIRVLDVGGRICIVGYHRTINDLVRPSILDESNNVEGSQDGGGMYFGSK